jgi:hypothetical protein
MRVAGFVHDGGEVNIVAADRDLIPVTPRAAVIPINGHAGEIALVSQIHLPPLRHPRAGSGPARGGVIIIAFERFIAALKTAGRDRCALRQNERNHRNGGAELELSPPEFTAETT